MKFYTLFEFRRNSKQVSKGALKISLDETFTNIWSYLTLLKFESERRIKYISWQEYAVCTVENSEPDPFINLLHTQISNVDDQDCRYLTFFTW